MVEVRRPRDPGRIDVNYGFDAGRGNLNVSAIYNGETEDNIYLPVFPYTTARTTLDDYWLVNVAASYKLTPGVEIYGRVENLLDEKYEEVYSYATPGAVGLCRREVHLRGARDQGLERGPLRRRCWQ